MYYDQIKKVAKTKGVSIRKIEMDLELSNGSLSKWNLSTPSVDKINKVAEYLNVPISELLKESEPMCK